jgi:hypothetical protein
MRGGGHFSLILAIEGAAPSVPLDHRQMESLRIGG